MKIKYAIYISAFFVLVYLVLQNPSAYQTAMNKATEFFGKTFSAFGRVKHDA